jgi:recombinational DNA repair protein RecR
MKDTVKKPYKECPECKWFSSYRYPCAFCENADRYLSKVPSEVLTKKI